MSEAPWTADDSGRVRLTYARCTACGRRAFPPQQYGCERCGAVPELLVREQAEAAGKLVASVIVNMHPTAGSPFGIAEIAIGDTGLIVEARLGSPTPAVGTLVVGRAAATPEGQDNLVFLAEEDDQ